MVQGPPRRDSDGGGDLLGVPLLVSSGIRLGQLVLLDALQIAAAAGQIDITVGTQTAVEMSDTPAHDAITPTGASLVSMFQTNSVAMRAVATVAAERLRDDAIALIEGCSYGDTSP